MQTIASSSLNQPICKSRSRTRYYCSIHAASIYRNRSRCACLLVTVIVRFCAQVTNLGPGLDVVNVQCLRDMNADRNMYFFVAYQKV